MATSHSFHFLGLPREIRDKIYAYALIKYDQREFLRNENQILQHPKLSARDRDLVLLGLYKERSLDPKDRSSFRSISIALLATNHQVRAEASRILYRETFFLLRLLFTEDPSNGFYKFGNIRRFLSDRAISLITRIELHVTIDVNRPNSLCHIKNVFRRNVDILACSSSLKEVRVRVMGKGPFDSIQAILGSLRILRGIEVVIIRGDGMIPEEFMKELEAVMKSPKTSGACTNCFKG